MRKKVVIISSLIFILVSVVLFLPDKIIKNSENISITRVVYNGVEIEAEDTEIIEILKKYYSIRTLKNYFPYVDKDISIEIDLVDNHRPRHILLGDFSIWYKSRNSGFHKILNAQKLKEELNSLLD